MSGEVVAVDSDTGEVVGRFPADLRLANEPMNAEQARKVTADIKAYAARLCHLVRDAKNGQAWTPLDYETWGEYVETEFGMSRQRAQQLIDHANKLDLLAEVVELASPPAEQISERKTRGIGSDALRKAITDALVGAPAKPSPAQRLRIAERAIDALRADIAETKAQVSASTTVDAEPEPPAIAEPDLTPEERLDKATAKLEQEGTGSRPGVPPAPQPPDPGAVTAPGDASSAPGGPASDEGQAVPPTAPLVADSPSDGTGDSLPVNSSDAAGTAVPPPLPAAPIDDVPGPIGLLCLLVDDLNECDPAEFAASLPTNDEHRRSVLESLDDLADWLHRFDTAIKEQAK